MLLGGLGMEKTNFLKGQKDFQGFELVQNLHNVFLLKSMASGKYCFSYDDDSSISIEFNHIEFDKKYNYILYCYSDKFIYVYDLEKKLLILKTTLETTTKVKYTMEYNYSNDCCEYLFIAIVNGKKEILSSLVSEKYDEIEVKTLTRGYDEIYHDYDYDKGVFYLQENGMKGLFCGNVRTNKIIEPEYNEIKKIGEEFYALTSNNNSTIVRFTPKDPLKTMVESCSIVGNTKKTIIYSKKGIFNRETFGLFFPKAGYDAVVGPNKQDFIKPLSQYFFEATKNNKKGIYHLENLIIPQEYKNIKVSYSPFYRGLDEARYIYFSLEKEKSCLLTKRTISYLYGDYIDTDSKLEENLGEYKDISFLHEIIVCRSSDATYIYDYYDNLLGKFSPDTTISQQDKITEFYDSHYYFIDGNCYYYEDYTKKPLSFYENNIYNKLIKK